MATHVLVSTIEHFGGSQGGNMRKTFNHVSQLPSNVIVKIISSEVVDPPDGVYGKRHVRSNGSITNGIDRVMKQGDPLTWHVVNEYEDCSSDDWRYELVEEIPLEDIRIRYLCYDFVLALLRHEGFRPDHKFMSRELGNWAKRMKVPLEEVTAGFQAIAELLLAELKLQR